MAYELCIIKQNDDTMNAYNKKLYPFKSKWINIDGNVIHYVDEGQGDIILFSHPPLGSSFMYRNFIRFLSKEYRCIAIDYPGFGLSVPHENYRISIQAQSDILLQFIQKTKLDNLLVLGHDTGDLQHLGWQYRNPIYLKD